MTISFRRIFAGIPPLLLMAAISLGAVGPSLAAEAESAGRLREAVRQRDSFLAATPDRAAWREYLMSDAFDAELAKGDAADWLVLRRALVRCEDLDLHPEPAAFRSVRIALRQRLEELPGPNAGELAALCKQAEARFEPPDQAKLAKARTNLMETMKRLDEYLLASGGTGNAWVSWLKLADLRQELAPDAMNVDRLEKLLIRFQSRAPGLELSDFARVRRALSAYVVHAQAMADPELQNRYREVLRKLAADVLLLEKSPSAQCAAAVGSGLQWLSKHDQAPVVVSAIRRRFARPILVVGASARLIATGIEGPIHETSPVNDQINGAAYRGNSVTVGSVSVALVPSNCVPKVEIRYRGATTSSTVGYANGVTIQSQGKIAANSHKVLVLEPDGLVAEPTVATATASSTILGINSGYRSGRGQSEVQSRVYGSQYATDQATARRTEQVMRARMDREIGAMADDWNRSFANGRRALFDRFDLYPDFRYLTTAEGLTMSLENLDSGLLGSLYAPPELPKDGDLGAAVHESLLSDWAQAVFGGQVMDEGEVRELLGGIVKALGGRLTPVPPSADPWTIYFAAEAPLTVSFTENRIVLTLRAKRCVCNANRLPAMTATVAYVLENGLQGFGARKLGKVKVSPFAANGSRPPRLSAGQIAYRTALESRLDQLLEPQWSMPEVAPQGAWAKAAALKPAALKANQGWLILDWKLPPAPAVTASNQRS